MKLTFLILSIIFFVCANAFRGRIVGGVGVEIEDYPYQISLQYRGSHFCGGSIYKPNVIITAAHCVNGHKARDLNIRAGSKYYEHGGISVKVKEIIVSEGWNEQTIDNDFAILILSENLQYSDKIQPIEIAQEEPKAGQMARVSGWGLLKEGGTDIPDILQAIKIPIWDRKSCSDLVSFDTIKLTENMMCAGVKEAGISTCQMDSGGPLVVDGKQVGVVSWGDGCGRYNTPNVFTNVPNYLNWITLKLKYFQLTK